jgi:hypothetical protein
VESGFADRPVPFMDCAVSNEQAERRDDRDKEEGERERSVVHKSGTGGGGAGGGSSGHVRCEGRQAERGGYKCGPAGGDRYNERREQWRAEDA